MTDSLARIVEEIEGVRWPARAIIVVFSSQVDELVVAREPRLPVLLLSIEFRSGRWWMAAKRTIERRTEYLWLVRFEYRPMLHPACYSLSLSCGAGIPMELSLA